MSRYKDPTMSPTEAFREFLPELIERRGLNAKQVSQRMGRSAPYMRLFLTGHTKIITLDDFCEACLCMKINPHTFLRKFYEINRPEEGLRH
jgi:hypothetical protein